MEILHISKVRSEHLQDDKKMGPRIISAYEELESETGWTDGYYMLLLVYGRLPFRDFKSHLRVVDVLDEERSQLILKQYSSIFFTYALTPGIYSIKNISEAVYTMGDHEGTLKVKCDDISMKTKLILSHFGGTSATFRFNEKSFLKTLIDFAPYWDHKPTNAIHADSPGVYTSEKFLNLSTIDKIHLNRDVIAGPVESRKREAILFSFVLNKPADYKVFCQPETVLYKKNLFCIR